MAKFNPIKIELNGRKRVVVTHHGVFHADEVTATALLTEFLEGDSVYVVRIPHQSVVGEVIREIKESAHVLVGEGDVDIYTVDVGKVFDPTEKKFDHHQWGQGDKEFGRSSAGLVFEYLRSIGKIDKFEAEELKEFVRMVDENDIGVYQGPWEGTIPWTISLHNAKDIYSPEQDERFVEMVKLVVNIIRDAKTAAASKRRTFLALKDAKEVLPGVLEMPAYLPGWQDMIFSIPELDHIDLVIWYDEIQKVWKIQQVPDTKGSFGRRGRKVRWSDPLPKGATFIHKGEFFGVFSNKEDLLEYIKTL